MPLWFKFEKDVSKLMKALGHDVQHISASRRGDHGIDIFATKTQGQTIQNWVIQCKCYAPGRKVGPSIVRELIGALSRYPAGTQGMLATTSTFTSGAMEEAKRSNIRLINGSEFLKLTLSR